MTKGDEYREILRVAMAPPGLAGAVRMSAALRELVRVFTGTLAGDDALDAAAAEVEALAARLAPHASGSRTEQGTRAAGPQGIFITHPLIGATNPLAPPIRVEPRGERLFGHVTYTVAHEGPPGFVHGGHIAAGFDVMVVMTAGINGLGGMSKNLAIRFRRPTRIGVPLVYEGTIDALGERSVTTRVELRDGDGLCAECTGEAVFAPRPRGSEAEG